ncbi:MAG: putative adenylate/guanylate cyclase [Nitrososphaeraceae archaeon]|nr:putative adenylate/guanylate cyclase [Nitrososphaeraceae archaeon]
MDARPSSDLPFRKLLDNVQGRSEFVIAVIIDVRGFSSFAMKVESVQTTAFLKRIYIEMIDRYFGNASFVKPTGDGLLLAFPHDETNLKEVASYCLTWINNRLFWKTVQHSIETHGSCQTQWNYTGFEVRRKSHTL